MRRQKFSFFCRSVMSQIGIHVGGCHPSGPSPRVQGVLSDGIVHVSCAVRVRRGRWKSRCVSYNSTVPIPTNRVHNISFIQRDVSWEDNDGSSCKGDLRVDEHICLVDVCVVDTLFEYYPFQLRCGGGSRCIVFGEQTNDVRLSSVYGTMPVQRLCIWNRSPLPPVPNDSLSGYNTCPVAL